MSFPYGVNRVNAGAPQNVGNPFSMNPPGIPAQGSENPHGSPERRGSTRARSREPRGERNQPTDKRPRTPRTPVRSVQEEAQQEDVDGRSTALENLAVTHATFLQQIHDDVSNMKNSVSQLVAKVTSLDEYAQNVDSRVTKVRDEAGAHFKKMSEDMHQRLQAVENYLAAGEAPKRDG